MAWVRIQNNPQQASVWRWQETGVVTNGETTCLAITRKLSLEAIIYVTFNGTYTDEKIEIYLKKRPDSGVDAVEFPERLVFYEGGAQSIAFDATQVEYIFGWEVSGTSPNYDIDIWVTQKEE